MIILFFSPRHSSRLIHGATLISCLLVVIHMRGEAYVTAGSMIMLFSIYYGSLYSALGSPEKGTAPIQPSRFPLMPDTALALIFFSLVLMMMEYSVQHSLSLIPSPHPSPPDTNLITTLSLFLACAISVLSIGLMTCVSPLFLSLSQKSRTL